MDTDKILTPFVSDDVVNECFKNLEEVWSCTEYEQLLTEVKVKADKKAESEATKNMRLRYDAVGKCLNQLEAAAGENKVWWERWIKEVSGSEDYTKIDFDWYRGHFPLKCSIVVNLFSKMCEAAKADELLSPEEQIFLAKCSPLPEMCMEVCKAMGIDEALTKDGQLYVVKHLKAICLYIALRNELNSLNRQATDYNISLKQPEKPKPEKQIPLSIDDLADLPLAEKREKWKDVFTEHAKRVFGIASGERKVMQVVEGKWYEWTYRAPEPSAPEQRAPKPSPTQLAFFLLLVYNNQKNIPWKQLQILFWPNLFDKVDKKGEIQVGRVLRNSVAQLRSPKKPNWFSCNINKLWSFKYFPPFPPHFPTWAQEIYLYERYIEDWIMREAEKKEKEKNKTKKKKED